jgi:hypothetical protein
MNGHSLMLLLLSEPQKRELTRAKKTDRPGIEPALVQKVWRTVPREPLWVVSRNPQLRMENRGTGIRVLTPKIKTLEYAYFGSERDGI